MIGTLSAIGRHTCNATAIVIIIIIRFGDGDGILGSVVVPRGLKMSPNMNGVLKFNVQNVVLDLYEVETLRTEELRFRGNVNDGELAKSCSTRSSLSSSAHDRSTTSPSKLTSVILYVVLMFYEISIIRL